MELIKMKRAPSSGSQSDLRPTYTKGRINSVCERAVKHRVAALKPQTRVARSILNVTTIKRSRKSSVLVRDLHVADSIILFTEWILLPGPNLHYPQCNLTSGSLARD